MAADSPELTDSSSIMAAALEEPAAGAAIIIIMLPPPPPVPIAARRGMTGGELEDTELDEAEEGEVEGKGRFSSRSFSFLRLIALNVECADLSCSRGDDEDWSCCCCCLRSCCLTAGEMGAERVESRSSSKAHSDLKSG